MGYSTKISSNAREQLEQFLGIFFTRFSKPRLKFLRQMLYGIQITKSVILNKIAAEIDENIKQVKIEMRLCHHLAFKDLWKQIHEAVMEHAKKFVRKSTLIIIDPSDVQKPYAKKMQYLAKVWDGSKSRVGDNLGYWGCMAVACEPGKRRGVRRLEHPARLIRHGPHGVCGTQAPFAAAFRLRARLAQPRLEPRTRADLPEADGRAPASVLADDTHLAERLAELPRPCGVLAANDAVARHIVNAAILAEIVLSDDLQVVGINNDVFLCENTTPTLTSVQPDFERSGYLAMETLRRAIEHPRLRPRTLGYGPLATIRRGSTRRRPHLCADGHCQALRLHLARDIPPDLQEGDRTDAQRIPPEEEALLRFTVSSSGGRSRRGRSSRPRRRRPTSRGRG